METPTAQPIEPHGHPERRGGTLRLWKPAADEGLDPGVYHVNNKDILYSTLTQPMTYQPTKNLFAMDGMVGYEQVDPLTLVWSIRPEMKFHNGDPVDAEAVAFSFGRLPKLYEAVDYTQVYPAGSEFVDSFEAAGVLTLTEHWSRANADALVHRARHYYSFLNPRLVEEQGEVAGVYTAPDDTTEEVLSVQDLPFGVGSGPYTLVKRDAEGARIERWPDYHRHVPADDGFVEDGPFIDAWETRVLPDRDAARAAFIAGELDVFDLIDPEELPEFEGLDHVSVAEIPNGGYSMLGMDGAKFHDRRARLALQKAFDYEGFIETFRPGGARFDSPISPLLPHFQKLTQTELREWYRYDPQEARALWEAAEFVHPVETLEFFEFSGTPPFRKETNDFVAESLGSTLGVETDFYFFNPHVDYDRVPVVKPWDFIGYGSEAGGTTGLPHNDKLIHYDPELYGRSAFNFHAESSRREVALDSVALTAMLQTQEQEFDFKTRGELLTDIQRWILDRHWCNWALPINAVQYYGFSSRLRDHAPEEWPNLYDLRRESMWLAEV